MRRNLGDAGVESVFSAEANREEVGIELLGGLPEEGGRGREIVLNGHVAQVEHRVEAAEFLRGVERHAVEVLVVFNLLARADGVAVARADVEGNTERAAAGSGVVKAENSAVDVGFIAGIGAVEALGFVRRAEDVDPRGHADFAADRIDVRLGEAAVDGADNFILSVEGSGEGTAERGHVGGSVFSVDEGVHEGIFVGVQVSPKRLLINASREKINKVVGIRGVVREVVGFKNGLQSRAFRKKSGINKVLSEVFSKRFFPGTHLLIDGVGDEIGRAIVAVNGIRNIVPGVEAEGAEVVDVRLLDINPHLTGRNIIGRAGVPIIISELEAASHVADIDDVNILVGNLDGRNNLRAEIVENDGVDSDVARLRSHDALSLIVAGNRRDITQIDVCIRRSGVLSCNSGGCSNLCLLADVEKTDLSSRSRISQIRFVISLQFGELHLGLSLIIAERKITASDCEVARVHLFSFSRALLVADGERGIRRPCCILEAQGIVAKDRQAGSLNFHLRGGISCSNVAEREVAGGNRDAILTYGHRFI